jgi:hypothetical protein
LQIAELTERLEDKFLDYVKCDYYDYYFFICDWLLQKSKTQVYLALEGSCIVGLMLIYEGNIVQLRGESKVINFLLDNVKVVDATIQAPLECEKLLTERYPSFKQKETVMLLSLKKGQERLNIKVKPQRLGESDAEEIAALMRESYPKMWSDIAAQYVRERFGVEQSLWLGIKIGRRLVSFGYATITSSVSHVTWVATLPGCQNRGYATSIISMLVKECFKQSIGAVIYVMDNNAAAKGVYVKVGFRFYKSYIFLKT